MNIGDLSFESPPLLRVTWTIPDFFRLAAESDYYLRSPDFTFADGRHCLRLFHTRDLRFEDIRILLLNLNDTDPGRAVFHEVVLKSTDREIDFCRYVNNEKVFRLDRSDLECHRDECAPDGALTVLCSVRPREPGCARSPESGGAQTPVFPQYRMTGNLSSESFPCLCVTWRIRAFFQPTRESGCDLLSPEFPFSDRPYRLRLFQSGSSVVDIHLVNLSDPDPGRYVFYEVGLKSTTGEEILKFDRGTPTTREFFIFQGELDAMQRMRFPDGHLTVFCCIRSTEPSCGGSPKCVGTETAGSKAPLPQAATRPKSVAVQTSNEEDDKEGLPGISKLSSELRKLFQKMPDSDACLVVSGKEFRGHQNILRARSTVFEAMFGHETAERESRRVVIDDLDPGSFGDFLEYLYTGIVREGLSNDNAFGLYKAGDKYDVPSLKSECVAHMRRSLSVDSFCDVLAVALRHSEELLSRVVLFFKENMPRIIVTAKWQQFVIDNGKSANYLLIKAFVPPGQ